MKTSFQTLVAAVLLLLTASISTLKGQGSITFEEPFHFITDDGCGDFYASGTLSIRINGNQMEMLKYEGTAVNVATGEATPLHVRLLESYGPRGFTVVLNGVYPGVMQFHYVLHVNLKGNGDSWDFNVVEVDHSHCIN